MESEAGVIVRVNLFEVNEPLRLKWNETLESGPVLPAAFALICNPEVVPAKLKVTGELPIALLRLSGTVVGIIVRANCILFPFCCTTQLIVARMVPVVCVPFSGILTLSWVPNALYWPVGLVGAG